MMNLVFLGSVLELPKMGTLKERFYLLENLNIHDSLFMDKKYTKRLSFDEGVFKIDVD